MAGGLQQVMALDALARAILLEGMFGEHGDDMLALLKGASPEVRNAFYASFPGAQGMEAQVRAHFEGVLEEVAAPDARRLEQAGEALARAFGVLSARVQELEEESALVPAQVRAYRETLKSGFARFPRILSDQRRGIPAPPAQPPHDPQAEVMPLPPPADVVLRKPGLLDCIRDRRSRRQYSDESIGVQELSYLLWATQGLRAPARGRSTLRTVPSGGARHPLETYLAVLRVDPLPPALYRYLPLDHKLLLVARVDDLGVRLAEAALGQEFLGQAAVTFIWSAVPYRCEWRYTVEAKKLILQDSGHVCQNLYLACESIGCGTVAIGAYDQEKADALLGVDGDEELVVYMAPVGRTLAETGSS
ncbi:MAG: SagB/ThcOx family dehydrogenase [Candidatus Latescibacterota bacterium]